jgi:RNA polymerase sigma-70 factor (ECF subfamily)
VQELDPLNLCTDEELVERLRRGHRDVFGTLVRRYEQELYGYLRRYLRDGELADDVFQNTFLQVYTKVGQFELGRPFRPWLYAVATNQAIDALRRAGRHAGVRLDQPAGDDADGEARTLLDLLEARDPGPPDAAHEAERRDQVRAAVDKLPELLRQAVILVYFQGLKYREAADILEVPVGTVKSRLHAALTKLHEAWTGAPSVSEL